MTAAPPVRSRRRDRLIALTPWVAALVLFATSMAVAAMFRDAPGPNGPGPSEVDGPKGPSGPMPTVVPWAGPDLLGVFASCNPACDLEVAMEGIARRLTFTDRAVDESAPSISPDLSRVAYRCAEPGIEPGGTESPRPAGLGSICLVGMLGAERDATPPPVTVLLSGPDVDYGAPAWSPDGTTIAVDVRAASGSSRIGLLDVATGGLELLATDAGDISNPAWSTDGSLLGFVCGVVAEPGTASTRFCTMPGKGGDVTAFGSVDGSCGTPAFMPDGNHVGVVCVPAGGEGADLFILSLGEPFTARYTESGLIAPEGIRRVVFSPDQHHAFVRRDDAVWAIGIPKEPWSLPPLPPLHGDFDLRVVE